MLPWQIFAQACPSDGLQMRSYSASQVDDELDIEFVPHRIYYNPDCPSNNKLLLHMVGSYDVPVSTTFFPSLAANNGYKAISLKYPNLVSATELCKSSNDVDCYTNFHEEIIYGIESLDGVSVNQVECIYNRILKLLIFLDEEYPTEGWGEFLTSNNDIEWSKITLSGHSQGGGHAVYLAKNHSVDRVITFASPNEFSDFFQAPAPWLSEPGLTPDEKFYAFANTFDGVIDYNDQYQCWNALNMTSFGDTLNVKDAVCPYLNTRLLYINEMRNEDVASHSLMVIDDHTPIMDDKPEYEPVWEYLLGICTTSSTLEINNSLKANVFPNPVTDQLSIESEEIIHEVQVYNAQGTSLFIKNPKSKITQLNMSDTQGLVFVKLISSSNKIKLVKLMAQ